MIFRYWAPQHPEGEVEPPESDGVVRDDEQDAWMFEKPGPALAYVQDLLVRGAGEGVYVNLAVELHSLLGRGERGSGGAATPEARAAADLAELRELAGRLPDDLIGDPRARFCLGVALDWLHQVSEASRNAGEMRRDR